MDFNIALYKRNFLKTNSELIQEIKFQLGFDFSDKEIKEIRDSMHSWLSKNKGDHYTIEVNYRHSQDNAALEYQDFSVTLNDAVQDLAFKIETDIIANLVLAKYSKNILKDDSTYQHNIESIKKIIEDKFKAKKKNITLVSSKITDNFVNIRFEDKKEKKTYEYKNDKGIMIFRTFSIK
jgi:predicted ribosome quality control (RQC) complex YloA/Tae2 family protein